MGASLRRRARSGQRGHKVVAATGGRLPGWRYMPLPPSPALPVAHEDLAHDDGGSPTERAGPLSPVPTGSAVTLRQEASLLRSFCMGLLICEHATIHALAQLGGGACHVSRRSRRAFGAGNPVRGGRRSLLHELVARGSVLVRNSTVSLCGDRSSQPRLAPSASRCHRERVEQGDPRAGPAATERAGGDKVSRTADDCGGVVAEE